MLLNCGAGENLRGDQTSQSKMKTTWNIHWKDWCWSWNSNTLATWCEELTHWKRPWCWERLKARGEGVTEDEMVGWHHWLDAHEFEQAPGVGDGQGSLVHLWCCKEWDTTEWLNGLTIKLPSYNFSNLGLSFVGYLVLVPWFVALKMSTILRLTNEVVSVSKKEVNL